MSRARAFNDVLRHVWCEPRFVAEMEWSREYSVGAQMMGQVPRHEVEQFVDGEGWENPDRTITIEFHEPPDFDWWEPTSAWRRKAARDRGEVVEA